MDKLKVLIIDDESFIRNLLKRPINSEDHGMTILGEASNAHEAFAMMTQLKPDLVFVCGGATDHSKAGDLIVQVKNYMDMNLSDPNLGLASTAMAFYVSPGHLGRRMKKETGQTFVKYLTNIRMKKAEILLRTTELKGYQIGEMVGIHDPHYFSILFKKVFGKSIHEYRNDIRSDVLLSSGNASYI